MLRDDISPVKVRIKSMSETLPHVPPSDCSVSAGDGAEVFLEKAKAILASAR